MTKYQQKLLKPEEKFFEQVELMPIKSEKDILTFIKDIIKIIKNKFKNDDQELEILNSIITCINSVETNSNNESKKDIFISSFTYNLAPNELKNYTPIIKNAIDTINYVPNSSKFLRNLNDSQFNYLYKICVKIIFIRKITHTYNEMNLHTPVTPVDYFILSESFSNKENYYRFRDSRLRLITVFLAVLGLNVKQLLSLRVKQLRSLFQYIETLFSIKEQNNKEIAELKFFTELGFQAIMDLKQDFENVTKFKKEYEYVFTAENSNTPLHLGVTTRLVNNYIQQQVSVFDSRMELRTKEWTKNFAQFDENQFELELSNDLENFYRITEEEKEFTPSNLIHLKEQSKFVKLTTAKLRVLFLPMMWIDIQDQEFFYRRILKIKY